MATNDNRTRLVVAIATILLFSVSCSKRAPEGAVPGMGPEGAQGQNPGLNQYDYSLKTKHRYDYRRIGI